MASKTNDDRIMFHTDKQIMEVDFSDILFESAPQVNEFYDLVDKKMAATGQDKWYFLVNYKNCKVALGAWIPFSNRGKKINIASSLGSVRYAVSKETGKSILDQSEKENFDPNLFTSRQTAVDHLANLKKQAAQAALERKNQPAAKVDPSPAPKSIASRIRFDDDLEIMHVDFSDYVFDTIGAVDEFYDAIATRILETDKSWFFLVNYTGTKIFPNAWFCWSFSHHRNSLNRRLKNIDCCGTNSGRELARIGLPFPFDSSISAHGMVPSIGRRPARRSLAQVAGVI